MKVGIIGTGNLARTLGKVWAGAGHDVRVTGRDPEHVKAAAEHIGGRAGFGDEVDAIVTAVAWSGLGEALRSFEGDFTGKTVIDCTNPVDFTTGAIVGRAAALVAGIATGGEVVKALHMYAGASWPYTGPAETTPLVAICGDSPGALARTTTLVADLGGKAVVVGGLDKAGQLEEAAGFVVSVVAAGHNPRYAVPSV